MSSSLTTQLRRIGQCIESYVTFRRHNSLCLYIHILTIQVLIQLTCSVGNNHIIYPRLMTVLGLELLLCGSDEVVVKVIFYKIDGTASETAAHNARTGDSALFGYAER